jgi:hypothetical protein
MESLMKTITLLTALNIPCTGDETQSARNYAGAVVDVADKFAEEKIALGEAELYVPLAADPTATNTPEATAADPPKPSPFNDSRFGAEDA